MEGRRCSAGGTASLHAKGQAADDLAHAHEAPLFTVCVVASKRDNAACSHPQ